MIRLSYPGLTFSTNNQVNLDKLSKKDTKTFFQTLAETGYVVVKLNSMNNVVTMKKGHVTEEVDNPSSRTGKNSFFEISASFPLYLAKRAEIAQLIVQGMLLAQAPIKDIGRIENDRMIIAWRLKINSKHGIYNAMFDSS